MRQRIATRWLIAAAAGGAALLLPGSGAGAQGPSLKELLEKAQSKSDAIAVEEIVKGLKPKSSQEPPAPVQPAASPPASPSAVVTPESAPQAPATAVSAPAVPPAAPPPAAASVAAPAAATSPAPPIVAEEKPAPPVPPVAPAAAEPPMTASVTQDGKPAAADVAKPAEPPEPVSGSTAAAVKPEPEPETPATSREAESGPPPSLDFEVLFAFDSDEISPESHVLMVRIGKALTDSRLASRRFEIVGHTDAKGSDVYNLALSARRAAAVRKFLVENFAIAAGRLTAIGKGERQLKNRKQPLASENRRVEIVSLPDKASR